MPLRQRVIHTPGLGEQRELCLHCHVHEAIFKFFTKHPELNDLPKAIADMCDVIGQMIASQRCNEPAAENLEELCAGAAARIAREALSAYRSFQAEGIGRGTNP